MAYVTQSEYKSIAVRAAAILTNSYVAGTVIGVPANTTGLITVDNAEDWNYYSLLVNFTLGSLTDGRVKAEFSDDNTNWYQGTFNAVAAGAGTLSLAEFVMTATGLFYIPLNAFLGSGGPLKARYIRISAIGTGTVTSSSMTITALCGVA